MYLVAWTEDRDTKPEEDFYVLFETRAEADAKARKLSEQGNVYCWAVTSVLSASEPHWMQP